MAKAKKSVDYKKKYLFVLELLKKLMRKDIPVSDLPNIIKKLESED
jgi:hypothetical protein